MTVVCQIHELRQRPAELRGELSPRELGLEGWDAMLHFEWPLQHHLWAELIGGNLLVRGWLCLPIECDCVRCLRRFPSEVRLTDWSVMLALEGEERVCVHNDAVDLTPFIREDIVLALPQHPLCQPDCLGLPYQSKGTASAALGRDSSEGPPSVWAELDKLNL